MRKMYYIRVRTPRRSSPVKRSSASPQKLYDSGPTEAPAAPAAFSFDSASGSNTRSSPSPLASPAHGAFAPPRAAGTAVAVQESKKELIPPLPAESDERFERVQHRLTKLSRMEQWHEPVKDKVAQAKFATKQPDNERLATGMHSRVRAMDEAKTKPVDDPQQEEGFLNLLEAALAQASPKSKSDIEDLAKNPSRKDEPRQAIREGVEEKRLAAEGELPHEASHEPEEEGEIEKAQDVPPVPGRGAPLHIGAGDVLPLPKPESEASFDDDKQAAEDAVRQTGLSEEEIAASNEPSFKEVLSKRDKVLEECAADSAEFRKNEAEFLKRGEQEAVAGENQTRLEMRHVSGGEHLAVHKQQTDHAKESHDERQRITTAMQFIYTATKIVVDAKLASLEPTVDQIFTGAFNGLFEVLQDDVREDMDAWEDDRHSGLGGKFLWWKDKIAGTSELEDVKAIYNRARARFETSMRKVFKRIAKFVDDSLRECKQAIATGEELLIRLVEKERDPRLKQFARDTANRIGGDFAFLRQSIDQQEKDLAQNLAGRYQNSRATVDTWIKEDKKKHQGWARDLRDKAREIYEILVNFKNKLLNVLRRGVEIIMSIVRHPIRFLENLVASVKKGIHQFKENIGQHLREAALQWLFGEIPVSEIHLPKDVSAASIFGLAMELLGFTPQHMRERAARIIGEGNVELLEKVFSLLAKYFREGPAALWEEVQSMLGGLRDAIIEGVRDWVIAQVIKRGIAQLALMLNPVGAFIEACIAIYNLIVFFIDRARQIGEFLSGILDSVEDMVNGKIDAAAKRVEDSMTRAVSLLLGFLTSLVGVPSPAGAIRQIVQGVREKIDRGLDWMLEKFKKLASKAGFAIKTAARKVAHLIFPPRRFVAGEKKHTIEAEEAGDDYRIVVHTETHTTEEIISRAAAAKLPEANTLSAEYRKFAAIKVGAEEKDNQRRGEKLTQFSKVAALIAEIFPKLSTLTGKKHESHILYGTRDPRLGGTLMVAHPLAEDNLGKGSKPDQAANFPPIWSGLYQQKRDGHRLYIKGHLLNQKLGGPGDRIENITPFTYSANATHESHVESHLKNLITKGSGKMAHYEVHVNYPAAPRKPEPGILPGELELASSITTKWYELEDKQGALVKKGQERPAETIRNVPPYP